MYENPGGPRPLPPLPTPMENTPSIIDYQSIVPTLLREKSIGSHRTGKQSKIESFTGTTSQCLILVTVVLIAPFLETFKPDGSLNFKQKNILPNFKQSLKFKQRNILPNKSHLSNLLVILFYT